MLCTGQTRQSACNIRHAVGLERVWVEGIPLMNCSLSLMCKCGGHLGRITGKPEVTRLGREERNVREKGSSPQQWKRQIPNPQPNPQERPSFVTSAYFGSPPRCCMLLYNLITQRCDGRGRFSMQVHDGLTLRSTSFCLDMYGNVCGRQTIRLWILFPASLRRKVPTNANFQPPSSVPPEQFPGNLYKQMVIANPF